MKRIAIIADPIDNQQAGVHVYTRNMLFSLLDNDDLNYYIVFREKRDNTLQKYQRCLQVVIPNFIGFTAIRKFIIIPLLSMYHRANIVIEPAHFGPFFLPKSIQRVTVIHDLSAVLFPQWHSFYSSTLQRLFLPRILKNADLIISNSHFTENEIAIHYPGCKDKIQTIYPGVEAQTAIDDSIIDIESHEYFLYVGTIEPRKNLNLLLHAFKMYKSALPESRMQLYVVGAKGWKVDSFFQELNVHPFKNDIHILGYVSDVLLIHYYRNCKAFVYPSIYEGFGFPVVEAMRQGATVITTADSSMSEIAGSNALFFKNKDAHSLCDAMMQVDSFKNTHDAEELILHSQKYNWSSFGVLFKNILNRL